MASNKKNELIVKTYEMLKTTSPSDIKIRNIASACNCTTPVIYKYFDDLDHLVRFAAVRFLENYIIDLQESANSNSSPLDMLISMWDSFAKYAFENVEIFELFFWGRYKEQLGDTIFEYYQLFPDKWKNLDGLFTSVFFNNDLKERNYLIVRRAAVTGHFSLEDARLFSDICCDLFHGLLLEYKDSYRDPAKVKEGAETYMQMLMSLIGRYRIK